MTIRSTRQRPVVTLMILLGVLILAGGVTTAYLFYFRPVAQAVGAATGQVVPRPAPPDEGNPSGHPAPAPTPPSLTGSEPINVLLLGSDTDAKFAGDYNTQIMIVVSIRPAQKKVSMLSIPRDLWVPIPGHGVGKIGVAFGAGGVALTRQAVESDFGIPVHYYAWVGLEGFIKVIDTFGGVDVDVSHPIVDDSYPDDVNSPDPYAYRRLYIPAGPQHLDGMRALEYVRSRHGDLIGDFGRSKRQQQVLDTLRSKSGTKDVVTRLPELANDLKDSVRTDMTLQELVKFAAFADQIRGEPVQQYTLLPPKFSDYGTSADGQSIVIPKWPEIRPLIDGIFGLNTAATLPMRGPEVGPIRAPAAAGAAPKAPEPRVSAPPAASAGASAAPKALSSAAPKASASATPHALPTSQATHDVQAKVTPTAQRTAPALQSHTPAATPTARKSGA